MWTIYFFLPRLLAWVRLRDWYRDMVLYQECCFRTNRITLSCSSIDQQRKRIPHRRTWYLTTCLSLSRLSHRKPLRVLTRPDRLYPFPTTELQTRTSSRLSSTHPFSLRGWKVGFDAVAQKALSLVSVKMTISTAVGNDGRGKRESVTGPAVLLASSVIITDL